MRTVLVTAFLTFDTKRCQGISLHFPTPAPTAHEEAATPTSAPHRNFINTPSPTAGESAPNPTAAPVSPTKSPVISPTIFPTEFKEIAVLEPVAGTYAYDLGLLVKWTTKGEAIEECNTVDVDLYQNSPDGSEFISELKSGIPNDLSAQFTWTPSETVNRITEEPYGIDIVGDQYQIRVICTIGYSDFSDFFDISVTPEPTSSPTPLPSFEPTPLPTSEPTPLPTPKPSQVPTPLPTLSLLPSNTPTPRPTLVPSPSPTQLPTEQPSPAPSPSPSFFPTHSPTPIPSAPPTAIPSLPPTPEPTSVPSTPPSPLPSFLPSPSPSPQPTPRPTLKPSPLPTMTLSPSSLPTQSHPPTPVPTLAPTRITPKPTHKPPPTIGDVLSSASAGIAYACIACLLVIVAAVVAYRRHTAVGGRGFKGDVNVDAGAFLQGDPTESYHGDVSIHVGGTTTTPLIDPRDDSFASGWSDAGGGEGTAV